MNQYIVKDNDDLRSIAARELKNPTLWVEIALVNNLMPPYIVTQQEKAANTNTVCPGDRLFLPTNNAESESNYYRSRNLVSVDYQAYIYGIDIDTTDGQLSLVNSTDGVDFLITKGISNVLQAVNNKFYCNRGSLMYHLGYGTLIRKHIGKPSDRGEIIMTEAEASKTIMQDSRVSKILSLSAVADQSSPNWVQITANVLLKDGLSQSIVVRVSPLLAKIG
jgi:hypothetical protein